MSQTSSPSKYRSQVEWLLSLGLLWLTTRALVHASGLYEPTLADMRELGIFNGTDSDTISAAWDNPTRERLRNSITLAAAAHDGTTPLVQRLFTREPRLHPAPSASPRRLARALDPRLTKAPRSSVRGALSFLDAVATRQDICDSGTSS